MSSELDISINSDFSGCSKDVSYLTLYSCFLSKTASKKYAL